MLSPLETLDQSRPIGHADSKLGPIERLSIPTEPSSENGPSTSAPIVYLPPGRWKVDNRKRHYIPLSARNYSRATDLQILRRSVEVFLADQDERGSFYTDEDYNCAGDKVDDQLGAAAALAYWLAEGSSPDKKVIKALERAVRFHLDHLVCPATPTSHFRYSRYFHDRDTSGDWANTNWCLWGGILVYTHGRRYLSEQTAADLKSMLLDYWSYLSAFPTRDENPCHNQLLAYCDIGVLLSDAIEDKGIAKQVLDYYHQRLRRLRIFDRGHWIYSEFNQWDANYGVLSWMALEHLYAATGDPALAEDAEEMALYFNEYVSAGGYFWGGSRREEGGLDEFVHAPARWATELELNRLLLPEPSNLWQSFIMDGHYTKVLVNRMALALEPRPNKRTVAPTPWHFKKREASVCLRDDGKMHHVSADGLEVIPSVNPTNTGSGVIWQQNGIWKGDFLVTYPPKASAGHRYFDNKPIDFPLFSGLATMQRGYSWETRQWWLGTGNNLLWIGQLITHTFIRSEKIQFVLGNPILTRSAHEAVPVTEVENAEGIKADTQGESAAILSPHFLRIGDAMIGGTSPVKFLRSSADDFHTFPDREGRHTREISRSNELRVTLCDSRSMLDCRESLFFAVELGRETPQLSCQREDAATWKLQSRFGEFVAKQTNGIWSYTFGTASQAETLPDAGFKYRPV